YAARAAGVRTPRLLGMAEAADTMLLIQEHVPGAVPLRELPVEDVTDELLDLVWAQVTTAHRAGLAHRALTAELVLVAPDEPDVVGTPTDDARPGRVWIAGWSSGDVASSELARRFDL